MLCLCNDHCLDIIIIIWSSISCPTVICLPTVCYFSREKPLVKTYGPRLNLLSYKFYVYFYLHLLLSNLYHKNTKNIYLIILSLSDLTFASFREGIDNPFIALVARFLFVCVGVWDFWGASYWIDTLVLTNWGKYLHYFAASPFPLQGKPTQAQDVAATNLSSLGKRQRLAVPHLFPSLSL